MLVELAEYLAWYISAFNAVAYITLRAILAMGTALVFCIWIGPSMIRWLGRYQIAQPVRDDGPKSHFSKVGTPTMGGVLIIVAITVTTLLWADLSNRYVWLSLFAVVAFGAIGWLDDYLKIARRSSKGLMARHKYLGQSAAALLIAAALYWTADSAVETTLLLPVLKDVGWQLGWLFVPLAYVVIVGTSNAVNLTDGLDGLAILPTVLVAGALGVFAYVTGHAGFAEHLNIPFLAGVGELLVFCAAMVGAGLGFLWFNAYPAQVFMGDVGALALGAALGVVAVIARQELVLFIMGGVFVMETVSVILQVASFKLTGRRIFRMAPLHHHFELKGWPEPRVIVRFWILTVVLVLIGLATLKVR